MRNQLCFKKIIDSFLSTHHDNIQFNQNNFFDKIFNSFNQIHEFKITNIILYNIIRDWSHEVNNYKIGVRRKKPML